MLHLTANPSIRRGFRAYTMIELLAVMFIFTVPTVVFTLLVKQHGRGPALAGATIALPVAIVLVVLFYRWSWWQEKESLRQLREKYRTIYRVTALPEDPANVFKPEGAEIRIGDFGWEARPRRKDGLIHLQGLTPGWLVAWHAAFRPEHIEPAATKTSSQYDYRRPYWARSTPLPPCPYPILARATPTMGLPYYTGRYFLPPRKK